MASFPISPSLPEGAFSGAKGQSGESGGSAMPWSEINPRSSGAHDSGAQGESTSHRQIQFNQGFSERPKPVNITY